MTSQGRCGETDLQHLSSVPFAAPRTLISPCSTSGLCVGSSFTFLLCPPPPVSPTPLPRPVALIFTPLSGQRVGSHPRPGAHPAQSPSLLPSPPPQGPDLVGRVPSVLGGSQGAGQGRGRGRTTVCHGLWGVMGSVATGDHPLMTDGCFEGLPGLMRALGVECQGSLATPYPSRGSL